jgi:MFS transporter, ACS family, glucarate transporter
VASSLRAGACALKHRYWVLLLLGVLAIITYLDRVCIAVAGPRIQADLQLTPTAWGWVGGMFVFAYAAFEIPSGSMADRYGPRRVLTRIVLWWSAFTSLTGAASNFWALLAIRFSFGAGEAGALPNFSSSISRWFPTMERARALGLVIMTTQLGGALTPLLVVPIQARYGWRTSFYLFGILGVLWAVVWFRWYRDNPSQMATVSDTELREIGTPSVHSFEALPWRIALRSKNLWSHMLMAFGYYYAGYFFLFWFQTFLVRGRGFSEKQLLLSTLPFLLGACGNLAGGVASDAMVRKFGLKWGRRSIGMIGAGGGAFALVAAILTANQFWTLAFLALTFLGVTLIQPTSFVVCIDIAPRHAGAVAGAMNTAAQAGGFVSSIVFGYLVKLTGSYNIPLIPMVFMLVLSALMWLRIDPTEQLVSEF